MTGITLYKTLEYTRKIHSLRDEVKQLREDLDQDDLPAADQKAILKELVEIQRIIGELVKERMHAG